MQTQEQIEQEVQKWSGQLPVGYHATSDNVALIASDILEHEGGIYSVDSLNRAVSRVHTNPAWTWAAPARVKSQTEQEYDVVAAENPSAAQALVEWYDTTQSVLIKEADARWHNMRSILIALRGRAATRENFIWCLDYIGGGGRNSGGALFTVPRSQPKSESGRRHADDGTGFLGKDVNLTPAQRLAHSKPVEEVKAAEVAALSHENQVFKTHAEDNCRYGSHSAQAEITKVFNQSVAAGDSWRKVCDKTSALVEAYKRQAMRNDRSVR